MADEKWLINASHKNAKAVLEGVPYYPDEIWKFAAMAKRFPPIDAVEVVRCKDCKHLAEDGVCQQKLYGIAPYKMPKGDDFCSYGERKMVNLEDVVDIEALTNSNNEAMRKVIGFMTGKETQCTQEQKHLESLKR